MWYHMNDSIHWSIEGVEHHDEETLRPTCHLTYSLAFQGTPGYTSLSLPDNKHTVKHSVSFYTVAAKEILHGLCDVFPEGMLDGCDGVEAGRQSALREWEGVQRGFGY